MNHLRWRVPITNKSPQNTPRKLPALNWSYRNGSSRMKFTGLGLIGSKGQGISLPFKMTRARGVTGYCGPFLPPFHPSLCICLALGKNMSLCNIYKQTNAFTCTLFLWRFTLQVQRRQFSPVISYLLHQNISSTWHLGRNVYLPLFSIYLLSFHRKYHTILDICSTW